MSDDNDEFGADADFLEALATTDPTSTIHNAAHKQTASLIVQPTPQRLDRLDQAPPQSITTSGPKVIQPTPQVLKSHSTTSSILVSPRQKGNPVLINLRSFVWEYSDIPADYVLGSTICALFLSIKYHCLHPEYIYNRIKGLRRNYILRVLLTLVDVKNHEESIKELTKTCLVNNMTLILCWSTAEAARYIELYKSYEHSKDCTGIKGAEKKSYAEKMIEFITVPRGINKTDAVSLVSAFGSIKGAINAGPDEIAIIGGWGEKKVKRWCNVVNEPFKVRRTQVNSKGNTGHIFDKTMPLTSTPATQKHNGQNEAEKISQQLSPPSPKDAVTATSSTKTVERFDLNFLTDDDASNDSVLMQNFTENNVETSKVNDSKNSSTENRDGELSDGLITALAKLRRENEDF